MMGFKILILIGYFYISCFFECELLGKKKIKYMIFWLRKKIFYFIILIVVFNLDIEILKVKIKFYIL